MELTIVLLGNTGHGKSSTGNTLLNMEVFEYGAAPISVTRMLNSSNSTYFGIPLCVVDTPSLFCTAFNCDTRLSEYIWICDLMDTLMNRITFPGVNAFFFVYNITKKFTLEEERTIDIFEQIFGPEVISTFGVLVFTHCDHFEKDFTEWCGKQTGRLRAIIDKFAGNVVLISNRTVSNDLRNHSREAMISQALAIERQGQKYTLEDYKRHKRSRDLLIFHEKLGDLRNKFKHKIDRLETHIKLKTSMNKVEANGCIKEIIKIKDKINDKKKDTNELNDALDRLDKLEVVVNSKIATFCIIS